MYADTRSKESSHFSYLGFQDYLAARKLFLVDDYEYHFQAIVLASTAVEKFFKALLVLKGERNFNHLDKLNKFYNQFKKHNFNIENKLDKSFIRLLSNAYKFRYFDKLGNTRGYGFFTNQVIGELDYTIDLIANALEKKDQNGNILGNEYQIYRMDKSRDIHVNNYISMGITKEEFMKQPSKGFGMIVRQNGEIYTFQFKELISDYNGNINLLDISEDPAT